MLTTPLGDARWIWLYNPQKDERDRRVRFRKTFNLDQVPETFEIKVSADSKYTLYVNGYFVHHGPARNTPPYWSFDLINIASYLKEGKNLIAILGYQFGVSNFTYIYSGTAGVILSGPGVSTNDTWKISEDTSYIRAVAKGSFQYGFQEFCDLNKKEDHWNSDCNFDDSSWESDRGKIAGVMPYHFWEERSIPLLTNNMLDYATPIAVSKHDVDPNWKEIQSAVISFHKEISNFQPYHQEDNPTCIIYDFGREVVGMLNFEFSCDGIIDFLVCENLDNLTPVICGPNELHTAYGGRLYPVKGKVNFHELTLPWGLRYCIVYNRAGGKFDCKVSLRECRYPLEVEGVFKSSLKDLQQIWDMCELTQKCCMADSYIDCPTREYAQWWGDALVQSQNTFRLANDPRLLARGLRSLSRQLTPDGLTYGVGPGCAHNCILPDYSAMYLVTLLAYYEQTNSLDLYDELRNVASGIISYFEKVVTPQGTIPYDERYWLFVDWCTSLDKVIPYNLIVVWGLRSVVKLATLTNTLEDQEIIKRCTTLDEKIVNNLDYFNPSPHTVSMAILLDIHPELHKEWIDSVIIPMLRSNHDYKIQPDAYFMYYIFEALKKYNMEDEIINCIRTWYYEFVEEGFSTTPEHFYLDYLKYTSKCHAWSAHPLKFISELILGVRQKAPAWQEVSFNPIYVPNGEFSGTVPTPLGNIKVYVNWNENPPVKDITLPDGIKLV